MLERITQNNSRGGETRIENHERIATINIYDKQKPVTAEWKKMKIEQPLWTDTPVETLVRFLKVVLPLYLNTP